MSHVAAAPVIICSILLLQACATKPIVPPAAVQSGFLIHPERMTPEPERSPFALNWHADPQVLNTVRQRYTRIYVAPVNTSFLEQEEGGLSPEAVSYIATYFRNAFEAALKRDSDDRFTIVDEPQGATIIIELALIKLVPTIAEANYVANIGAFFIPGALLVTTAGGVAAAIAGHEVGKGRIAMAMKVTDAVSGDLLAEAYDEREDRAALIINTRDFTRWGNARMIIQHWASEFRSLVNTPETVKVSAPFPIGVIVW